MSSQALEIKTSGGHSSWSTVFMMVGGLFIALGIGYVLYVFLSPMYKALSGIFNFTSAAAGAIEDYMSKCFGGGGWSADCLWFYFALPVVGVLYAGFKLGGFTTAGSSEIVKQCSFETGRSNDDLMEVSKKWLQENESDLRDSLEEQGITGDAADLAVQSALGEMLKNESIEAAEKGGSPLDDEAIARIEKAQATTLENWQEENAKNLDDTEAKDAEEAGKDYAGEHPFEA